MKINSLLNEKLIPVDNKVEFDYFKYWKAVEAICRDIRQKYDLTKGDIGILGMARGALPLLVSVSHEIGIRKISTVQLQMSKSDDCYDYGEVKVLNEAIYNEYSSYILLEDIIFKGKTTNAAIDILKKKGKKVLGVYSLVMDAGFRKIEIENNEIEVNYAFDIDEDVWVYFLWEKNLTNENCNGGRYV